MSKWEKVKLGDVCEHKISVIDSKKNSLIDYIDISSINNEIKEIESHTVYGSKEAPSRAKQLIQVGDILVSTVRPNLNAVALVKQAYENTLVASTGFCILRSKEKISRNYLFHYCKSKKFINSLMLVARGASYPAVSSSDVKNTEIPLPPLEVQKQIAKNLDTVSELLTLRKKQLEELDELIKSVFYDMFGDQVTNDKGWKVKKIKDLASSISYGTSQKATSEKLGFPVLRMNNITYKGEVDLNDLKYIELSPKDEEKYLVYKGDLLFNRTNSKELVGKTAVFKEDKPMAFAGYLVKLVSNELANTDFISGFLNSKYGKSILLNMAKSIVGMANINAKELGNIKIPVPPIELQDQYSNVIDKVNEQKALVKQSIQETQTLFDSLMSQYFD